MFVYKTHTLQIPTSYTKCFAERALICACSCAGLNVGFRRFFHCTGITTVALLLLLLPVCIPLLRIPWNNAWGIGPCRRSKFRPVSPILLEPFCSSRKSNIAWSAPVVGPSADPEREFPRSLEDAGAVPIRSSCSCSPPRALLLCRECTILGIGVPATGACFRHIKRLSELLSICPLPPALPAVSAWHSTWISLLCMPAFRFRYSRSLQTVKTGSLLMPSQLVMKDIYTPSDRVPPARSCMERRRSIGRILFLFNHLSSLHTAFLRVGSSEALIFFARCRRFLAKLGSD